MAEGQQLGKAEAGVLGSGQTQKLWSKDLSFAASAPSHKITVWDGMSLLILFLLFLLF